MKLKHLRLLFLFCIVSQGCTSVVVEQQELKPRIVVLTDIAPNDVEPDDMESIIRLLAHADVFEIEALIATTGWSNTGGLERIDLIHDALNAYKNDLPNLKKRSNQQSFADDESMQRVGYWPSVDYLQSRTVLGSTKMGMEFIGEGNDSEGSDLIIKIGDENDDRPIWISVWGGGNTFAQTIWRVQKERSPSEFKKFLRKFRVYTITDQDRPWSQGDVVPYSQSAHQWMREFASDLMFFWDESAWKHQNETGKSLWDEYALHIQNHGSLGELYPKYKWGVEGDTPSFMHFLPNGLSDPDVPTQVSWSGYFELGLGRDGVTRSYTNYTGEPYDITTEYFSYFYPAMFNNFAARLDWANEGKGNINPVVIVNEKKGTKPIEITGKPGEKVTLDASGSWDPDGDRLTYKWWLVKEAGADSEEFKILNSESSIATIQLPRKAVDQPFHVVCEVVDMGVPNLTSYRRIIISSSSI